jgi:site-specific DNA recombinase
MIKKTTRCAIYTRKSSEEGLDQDFNSLDAQREAAEAYIKSQKHEGWEVIPAHYDDGGYSGGNIDRPALKALLADISSGKIDTVVVYKVDRLTRALSDFAKIIEVFDKQNVSFVSVTQQFNTTTSMGRLTLNVLLSFAQFEREVTGERIRDKIAASKKKGMWMGGRVPLGYDIIDKKLFINKKEAKIIKYIYERYAFAELTLLELNIELKAQHYKNKSYVSRTGNKVIGTDFKNKALTYILSNPIYIGKIKHKGKIYDGEHEAIISEELYNKVQGKILKLDRVQARDNDRSLLVGRIFDYHGNRMSPTYSYKYSANGRYRMRYYINRQICTYGRTNSKIKRVRADYIDQFIESELTKILETKIIELNDSKDLAQISANLRQIEDFRRQPLSFLKKAVLFPGHIELHLENDSSINVAVKYKRFGGKLCLMKEDASVEVNKEYFHPNDMTFAFIAKGFYWSKLLVEGKFKNIDDICKAHGHSNTYIKRALQLRFLPPKLIKKIIYSKDSQIEVTKLITINDWVWYNTT